MNKSPFIRLMQKARLSHWRAREFCLFISGAIGVTILVAYSFSNARILKTGSEKRGAVSHSSVHENSNVFARQIDQGVSSQPRSFNTAEQEFERQRIKGAPFSAQLRRSGYKGLHSG